MWLIELFGFFFLDHLDDDLDHDDDDGVDVINHHHQNVSDTKKILMQNKFALSLFNLRNALNFINSTILHIVI